MRIARIGKPGALYDALVAAQNCDDVEQSLGNLSVSKDVVQENVTDMEKIIGVRRETMSPHINGHREFPRRTKRARVNKIGKKARALLIYIHFTLS